ncbi:MAG TPA: glycosyltransferase family 4 protein [Pseudonocardiaceae bacterium]|jgi:glycosyltransferase involved in cell wall biosynthesis|nr:glycosyltransferase family 4 protein [Pseudonocardiaceae bacterium]
MVVRLNWKFHVHGSGSAAHSMRSLLTALVHSTDAELSIEDIAPGRVPKVALPPGLAQVYPALVTGRIDPTRFWHIRHATRQEEERHLLYDRVDVSPYGRNVWYLTPETSRYAVVPTECYTRNLTRAWVPSRHSRQALVAAGVPAEMIDRVPHGVDTAVFRPPDVARATGPFTFLAVTSATDWRRKGIDVLLRAYLAAFRAHDDVVLVIHARKGAGLLGGLLDDVGYRDGVSPRVEVRSRRVGSLVETYQSADCYVQPTRGEAFGLAILEAMASGLPVIVTRWGGHLDYCTDTSVLFVDAGLAPVDREPEQRGQWAEPDVDHLVHQLRTVHGDRDLGRRLAESARAVAMEWSWERSAHTVVQTVARAEERC